MKKKILYILTLVCLTLFTACADFTDVQPKGKNLLDKVTDLDLLLNSDLSLYHYPDIYVTTGDFYCYFTNITNTASATVKSLKNSFMFWDESVDRVVLTNSDSKYTDFYGIIGKVANPVLLNIDKASGDREMANRLKAEAYILRAWYHYLLVNTFAKAYNPATAATDPGIPYSKENDLLSVPNKKSTVQEVYDFILEDIKAALDLNSLADNPALMRVGKAFGYAVKAQVLMSMCDYSGAYAAATQSLAVKNTVDDHRTMLKTSETTGLQYFARLDKSSSEDLLYVWSMTLLFAFTPEMQASFEPGHIVGNYYPSDVRVYGSNTYGSYLGMNIPVWASQDVQYSPTGLTTVDMYLIQAECKIRANELTDAMNILNYIRERRIEEGVYAAKTATNATDAFAVLKNVSRTENFFSYKNFINLKRWNTEDAYKETLHRTVLGVTYELRPDSPLWIFPFPRNATDFNENLTQNY